MTTMRLCVRYLFSCYRKVESSYFALVLILVGESCDNEHEACPGLKYSVCRRGFCHCQNGFYEQDSACKAELGEVVEEDTDCGSGTFKDNRCVCSNDYFYQASMRACLRCKRNFEHSKRKLLRINFSCKWHQHIMHAAKPMHALRSRLLSRSTTETMYLP